MPCRVLSANEHPLECLGSGFFHSGKALMDGQITPVHLVQPLYKHLMGWPITLRDLEHIDDQVYRTLSELVDFEDIR
jgi:HECT-domain (ubiquitin-transferase)